VGDAWLILTRIAAFGLADPACPLLMLGLVGSVWLYQWLYESGARSALRAAPVRIALVVLMVVYAAVVAGSSAQAFIYFQF